MNSSVNRLTSGDLRNLAYGMDPKAQKTGRGFICRCPAHDDRNPSLSIALGRQGQLLLYCHAGCTFEDVMTALKRQGLVTSSLSYSGSGSVMYNSAGLPVDSSSTHEYTCNASLLRIWEESQSVKGTLGEVYLNRRLDGRLHEIPQDLRFLKQHRHTPSGNAYPCLIAAVREFPSQTIRALHRTYLAPDGKGKAPVEPAKMMLGQVRGGAVQLAPATDELIIAEGIETALTLQVITEKPAWAALSSTHLASVILPPLPLAHTLYIAQDNDSAGRRGTGRLANRGWAEGRIVRILEPLPSVNDFNDLLFHGVKNVAKR